jgi:pimeloyl-ACP methyl ester carboxylesterase
MDRHIAIAASPLAPGGSARIHYREVGAGPPLLVLHGGWGYDFYPFDRQIAALAPSRRIIVPDRSGYGGSGRLLAQEIDFHRRAAGETFALMEALAVERPILWGHSDGAVIALLMALAAPARVGGVIVEATHLFRRKPASRAFFETMRDHPDDLGARVTAVLAREHGDRWRRLISINGDAWLRLAEQGGDLYDARLPALRVPVLAIHGARDPRTEPGELEALRSALAGGADRLGRPDTCSAEASPDTYSAKTSRDICSARASAERERPAVRFEVFADGGHSPHSERLTADAVTRAAAQFLASPVPAPSPDRR